MATYSNPSDLIEIIPDASGTLFPASSYDTDYAALAAGAYQEINSYIGDHTATPTSEDMSEIEAMLVAHRRMTAVYATNEQDGSNSFRQSFKSRAYELLDDHIFPASASTPVQMDGFTGDGTIAVSVVDGWTADAKWHVRCSQGGSSPVFQIWWSRDPNGIYYYDVNSHVQFPQDSTRNTGDPWCLASQIVITITPGDTAFAVGDTWVFRTYSKWKKNHKKGIRMLDATRGF